MGGFKARAGALTLLFVAGSFERERLLELLEGALSGEMPPVPEEDEWDDEDKWDDEDLEQDLDDGSVGTLPPVLRPTSGPIAPGGAMRTTSKGDEFLFVAASIERWLRNCPAGRLELGPRGAKALAPLVCGWSATVTHALAAEPLTLAELDHEVGILDGDGVATHLDMLLRSGQAEELPGGGEPRYALTNWGREGISPIVAAVRFECHYPEDDVLPPDVFDVEAAFQMALPLVELPPGLRGAARLGVQILGGEPLMAGATAQVDRGRVVSSSPLLEENPATWATGTPLDWCEAVVDPATDRLTAGGDAALAGAMVEALHERLFGELSG